MNAVAAAALSAVVVCSLPLAAQSTSPNVAPEDLHEQRTGVSNPPPVTQDTGGQSRVDAGMTPGYQPTPVAPVPSSPALVRREPSASVAGTATVPAETREEPADVQLAPRSKVDVDAGIVTNVGHAPDELPVGTRFMARMKQTLSTASTLEGSRFTAELMEPVEQDGRVLLPPGTMVEGTVTEVRGGRRIHGAAALHLDPRELVMPDGSRRAIRAQVIDTSENFATRIDGEGTIVRRDHIKTTLAVLGATTGTAAVAGAVAGGGVGAVVGAGIGAGIGTAWWLKQDRQTVLPEETAVTFSLNEPMTMGGVRQ